MLALNGTADQLSSAYNLAVASQRSNRPPDSHRIARLADINAFKSCLGNGRYYDDYFAYFQLQIAQFGVSATVNEFLFKGDARAEDMLRRFFSGMFILEQVSAKLYHGYLRHSQDSCIRLSILGMPLSLTSHSLQPRL